MLKLLQQPYCLEAKARHNGSQARNSVERFSWIGATRKGLANGGFRGTAFKSNQRLGAVGDESTKNFSSKTSFG